MKSEKPYIVGIIPARYGSTRLAAKPLVDLCGKPMIQHVCERASQATLLDEVIVATDDDRIVTVVKNFGGNAIMTPASLRSGTDRIAFVAKELRDADIVVNIQGDEPLIAPAMIDEAVRPLMNDASIVVGTIVKKIGQSEEISNPNVVKVVLDDENNALYFSRSPIPYMRDNNSVESWYTHHTYFKHFGLYVFRREFLLKFAQWDESKLEKIEKLEQLRILEHGFKIKATITEHDSIPIDTAEDAEKVRTILQQQKKKFQP